jgi:hypothetical protein
MNCLLCLLEEGHTHEAVAICQHCGAGACEKHLFIIKNRRTNVGMASTVRNSRSLMCSDCYHEAHPEVQPKRTTKGHGQTKTEVSSLSQWWKRLTHNGGVETEMGADDHGKVATTGALPEPEEAVAMIERFLQAER